MVVKNTLESDISSFCSELPFWAKYISKKILSGQPISDTDIDSAYVYLLEELGLRSKINRDDILIETKPFIAADYKSDLLLTKLENTEGVNALIENQTLEFSPNLTIVYGENGSGKSGYVRLLKKVFYSKAPEDILKNINIDSGHKPINAKFTFKSTSTEIPLNYSEIENSEFEQFSVFDGKGLSKQLTERNEFEFRPAGLSFFANYTEAIIQLERKLDADLTLKRNATTAKDISDIFDDDSEIKTAIINITENTKLEEFKKFTPFSDGDKRSKAETQKQYDELFLATKNKETEVRELTNIRKLLLESKATLERINQYFTNEYLISIKKAIENRVSKELIAKTEGLENFKTEKIKNVGTPEWKQFITAADSFAKIQRSDNTSYPCTDDNCLLCHQPLSSDAEELIRKYWIFIKSEAEDNVRKSQESLERVKQGFEKINFNAFPDDNVLTIWLEKNHSEILGIFKVGLTEQSTLSKMVISDIQDLKTIDRAGIQTNTDKHSALISEVDALLENFQKDKQIKKMSALAKTKIFLEHKEKLNTHFQKIESCVNNLTWIKKAEEANFEKRKITETEKSLSDKYFNQKYVDAFNGECLELNGSFGIDVAYTGSAGKSYRQLKLKGENPKSILSEGEQKVIALADFLAEMYLSDINRGVIFDDPVTSLDETRKGNIAKRLATLASSKQTIIFTHDLVFVSSLINHCSDIGTNFNCHWIENNGQQPGQIWLNNSPSYEKEYRNAEPAKKYHAEANKTDCAPAQRESLVKSGFAALRTCYEVLVINDLFKNVVQRFSERVSIDSLSSVDFDPTLVEELQDSFAQCCRYMEGHSHSDKYSYIKPSPDNLNEEINRYEEIRKKIRKYERINTEEPAGIEDGLKQDIETQAVI